MLFPADKTKPSWLVVVLSIEMLFVVSWNMAAHISSEVLKQEARFISARAAD